MAKRDKNFNLEIIRECIFEMSDKKIEWLADVALDILYYNRKKIHLSNSDKLSTNNIE